MTIRDIVRSSGNRWCVPVRYREANGLDSISTELGRLFDEFLDPFWASSLPAVGEKLSAFTPSLDVKDTEKEIKVTVELPGMEEKDIELTLEDNVLTVKGEKKDEDEKKDESYYRVERFYGSFHRSILLPAEIDGDKVKARFKKGVLTVSVPKVKPEQAKRKIIDIAA